MRTIKVKVTPKIGKIREYDYDEPQTWEEAIEMSERGLDYEFKSVYLTKRKSNFQDKKRTALDKKNLGLFRSMNKEELQAVADRLGVDLDMDD